MLGFTGNMQKCNSTSGADRHKQQRKQQGFMRCLRPCSHGDTASRSSL